MSDLIDRLQKMSVCVYLAAEEPVADDIADGLRKAIERIAELEADNARLRVDAERYRYIREGKKGTYNYILIHAGNALDREVDAFIAAAKESA